jgi:hypothetical protein
MSEHDIDIRLLETFEGGFETLNNVLPRQAAGVWLFSPSSEEDLSLY